MEYYIIYGWSDCPFCESAVELLQNTNERHMVVNLDHDDILLEYFKKTYDWAGDCSCKPGNNFR